MSSTAGWLSKTPLKLSNIIESLAAMREELPGNLHNQVELGSQVTFFFEELNSGFQEEKLQTRAAEIGVPIVIRQHELNNEAYIELRLWLKPGHDLTESCTGLGISEFSSRYLLTEQTGEWHEKSYITEPGFAVQPPLAIAACGSFGWAVRDGPQKEMLQDTARTVDVIDSDVEIVLSYIRIKLSDGYSYTDILKSLNMYLFSILFDFSNDKLKMIGLKRRNYTNHTISYDHLFYSQSSDMVCMARTQLGVERIGVAKVNIRQAEDLSALVLTLI